MPPLHTNNQLYIVSTPIGNRDDLTPRALRVLNEVDVIYAEDTRHSRQLCQYFGIKTPLQSFHQHNEQARVTEVLATLKTGKSVALISDAGTPLISDPGFPLVRQAHENDIRIVPIPGACAAIAALSASGIACDQFQFMGFMIAKGSKRQRQLATIQRCEHTLIFYESVHRMPALLKDLTHILPETRRVCLAREITKKYEQIITASAQALQRRLEDGSLPCKGEFVVVIAGAPVDESPSQSSNIDHDTLLKTLCQHCSLSTAVDIARQLTGEKRKYLYQAALKLNSEQ